MRSGRLGPPYSPASNVETVIRQWRDRGSPPIVDRQWFERIGLSGKLTTRNLHALRYLRLVDDDQRPTELAERVRLAPEAELTRMLSGLVRTSYANVWAIVDPATATRSRIEDAFRHETPIAQRKRMVACFIGLCRMAGIRDEPQARPGRRIMTPPRVAVSSTSPSPGLGDRSFAPAPGVAMPAPAAEPAPSGSAVDRLLAKLPDFDPHWPDDVKSAWFAAFGRIVEGCVPRS